MKRLSAKTRKTQSANGRALPAAIKLKSVELQVQSPRRQKFDSNFKVDQKYLDSLPDVMSAKNDAIAGAKVAIQQVGVSNFRIPLNISIAPGLQTEVDASVVGAVSLDAHIKGINMSRILRSFYQYKNHKFTIDTLAEILKKFKKDLVSESARLKVSFSFPLATRSLRSNLEGYQYYNASFEALIDKDAKIRRFMELDFVYSSSCPCSSELAEHARQTRGIYSIPHSQRSKARVRVELEKNKSLTLLYLRERCLEALQTETQVIVKREDEQAFAELNGSSEKFVEDAARLLFQQFDSDKRIRDFEILCIHYESLHSHDAISAISKGLVGGMKAELSDFSSIS